jgi:hypothetical protein
MEYEYIIIGGGPSGLTLAWCLSKLSNKRILLIEKQSTLGGCHAVTRVNGLFSEHGPRIYSSTYVTFKMILEDMGLSFDDLFTEYDFSISSIGGKTLSNFTITELFTLFIEYIKLFININHGKNMSMLKFMNDNNFSASSKDYIDRLCRLTDGASADKYTVFEFLQLLNKQFGHKLYHPKRPTDVELFKLFEEKLIRQNVTIMKNTEVIRVDSNYVITKNKKIYGNNIILAIPPKPLVKLLLNSPIVQNAFGPINLLIEWSNYNSYLDYICIVFHWNTKLILPKQWGFPGSDWGLAFVVLSDYMIFDEKESKTVISTCITIKDKKSSYLLKPADDCTKEELILETFRQLKYSFPDLKNPTVAIISPEVYRENNKWLSLNTNYVLTDQNKIINTISNIPNIYSAGTFNGHNPYPFTSLESAVTNAVYLVNILIPNDKYKIKSSMTLFDYVYIIIFLILIYAFYKN